MQNFVITLCLIGTQLALCANPTVPLFVQWASELGWKGTIDATGCWDLVPPPAVFFEHWRFKVASNGIDILPCQTVYPVK